MKISDYMRTAKALLITDLIIFRAVVVSKIINIACWMTCILFVNAYLLPKLGIDQSFGLLSFAGMIAAAGMFELFSTVVDVVIDFEFGKIIYYYATLPIPFWMVLVRKMISVAITHSIITLSILPLGKILLWNDFNLLQVNWLQFFIILLVGNLFYGAFSIFVSSVVKTRERIGLVWMRFLFPLWFLGGFSFSWFTLKTVTPRLAYVILLNPMIYMTEAYRAVIIGPEGFFPFYYSIAALLIFSLFFGYLGIIRLKKHLDFV